MPNARLFASLVLALWLGTYTFRSYIPAAVWNLSDELPFHLKAVTALATQIVALLGVIIVLKWRRRMLLPLAIAFAAVTVTRQLFISNDAVGPYLSLAAWPLWWWFMAALADEVSALDADALVAPSFALAFALQLGAQSTWHGLDLASVRGPIAAGVVAALAIALVMNIARTTSAQLPRPHTSMAWLMLGPALFLEITMAGNAGRMGEVLGTPLLTTVILLQLGLLSGVIVAARFTQFWLRTILIALGFAATFTLPVARGWPAAIALVVPVVVIAGLREAADRRFRVSGAAAFTLSMLLFFVLIFAFYNAYEMPPLWLLAFAPLAVMAALTRRAGEWPVAPIATAFAAACALAVLHIVPPPPSLARASADLTVMTYNIHHGFDDDGMPGMQRTAEEIADANADLVAIQEIGRGWTLLGGNDLVAYLRWRFPDYMVSYTPINGLLWGLATMSRLPVVASDGSAFDAVPGAVRYGWTGVVVEAGHGQLAFYSTHVTPDLVGPMGDARLAEVEALQHLVRAIEPVVVAGDFNALPEDAPIQSMRGAFNDLGAAAGLGAILTWPAGTPSQRLDYVFARGVTVAMGAVPRTTASDHLPVVVRVRLAR